MRGSDIEYNPVFFSWVLVKMNGEVHLFVDPSKVTLAVRQHLNLEADVEMRETNSSDTNNNVLAILHPYEEIDGFLRADVRLQEIILDSYFAKLFYALRQIPKQSKKIWISDKSAIAFSNQVPEDSLCGDLSPVVLMKAIKNPVEMAGNDRNDRFVFFLQFHQVILCFRLKGMENAHIKDAAALCCFFAWLEKEVESQRTVTEISAANKLAGFRAEQADFVGLSFDTISSAGSNAGNNDLAPKDFLHTACYSTSRLILILTIQQSFIINQLPSLIDPLPTAKFIFAIRVASTRMEQPM